jgi:hypothetical protein
LTGEINVGVSHSVLVREFILALRGQAQELLLDIPDVDLYRPRDETVTPNILSGAEVALARLDARYRQRQDLRQADAMKDFFSLYRKQGETTRQFTVGYNRAWQKCQERAGAALNNVKLSMEYLRRGKFTAFERASTMSLVPGQSYDHFPDIQERAQFLYPYDNAITAQVQFAGLEDWQQPGQAHLYGQNGMQDLLVGLGDVDDSADADGFYEANDGSGDWVLEPESWTPGLSYTDTPGVFWSDETGGYVQSVDQQWVEVPIHPQPIVGAVVQQPVAAGDNVAAVMSAAQATATAPAQGSAPTEWVPAWGPTDPSFSQADAQDVYWGKKGKKGQPRAKARPGFRWSFRPKGAKGKGKQLNPYPSPNAFVADGGPWIADGGNVLYGKGSKGGCPVPGTTCNICHHPIIGQLPVHAMLGRLLPHLLALDPKVVMERACYSSVCRNPLYLG